MLDEVVVIDVVVYSGYCNEFVFGGSCLGALVLEDCGKCHTSSLKLPCGLTVGFICSYLLTVGKSLTKGLDCPFEAVAELSRNDKTYDEDVVVVDD